MHNHTVRGHLLVKNYRSTQFTKASIEELIFTELSNSIVHF